MVLHFDIATQRILRECISQTSLDLQAIRSRGNELSAAADTIYQDWTMNEDNMPDIYTPLEGAGAALCQRLHKHIDSYVFGVDVISIGLLVSNVYNGVEGVIESALLHYFKYSILAWWYQYRDTGLSEQYQISAEQTLQTIISSAGAMRTKLVPHYF